MRGARPGALCLWDGSQPPRSTAKQAYPTRSNIERTIAWIATQNGRRIKLRYLGTAKNDAWLHTRCAGLNLRTLVKAGLTRRGGVWALACPARHRLSAPEDDLKPGPAFR